MPCEKAMNILQRLQEMEFVAVELNLYLDTHPCDRDALHDFNCAVEMIKRYMHEYEEEFGPLLNFGMDGLARDGWQWAEGPWPWQW